MIKRLLIFTSLFCVLFDPQIPYFLNGVGFSIIIVGVFAFDVICRSKIKLNETFNYVLLYFFIISAYSIVRLVISGFNFEYILSIPRGLVTFLSCYYVYYYIFNGRKERIVLYMSICFSLNAMINIFFAFNPNLIDYISIFKGVSISSVLGNNPFRNSFLSMSGFYSIGTAYSVFFMFFSYLMIKGNFGFTKIITMILSLLSSILAARTSIAGLFFMMFFVIFKRPVYLVVLLFSLLLGLFLLTYVDYFNVYKNWMFEAFEKETLENVISALWIDVSQEHILFGLGIVNDGTYDYTDSGYLKDILFGGVTFMLVKLSILIMIFRYPFKVDFLFSLSLLFVILIYNFKGQFLFNSSHGMAVLYFVSFYFRGLYFDGKK